MPYKKMTAMPSKHVKTNDVILEVLVPRAILAESPLQTTLTLVNESSVPVRFGDCGDIPDCRIAIRDQSTGKPWPFTEYGKSRFGEGRSGQFGYGTLHPGEARSWTFDLRRCFALLKGKYALSVTVGLNPGGPGQSFDISVSDVPLDVRLDAP